LTWELFGNVLNGSNNIEIGTPRNAADNNTIQIGVHGTQTLTTIAGIYDARVTGSAVYVTSTGQLGVLGSSERFKTDIAPMPELSAKLAQRDPASGRARGFRRVVASHAGRVRSVAGVEEAPAADRAGERFNLARCLTSGLTVAGSDF
jgi:hypothetical protein